MGQQRVKRASDYLNDLERDRRHVDPDGFLYLTFGAETFQVAGGPYRNVPPGSVGVNMAAEIDHPHTIRVPTRDFCTPDMATFERGVAEACVATVLGYPVFVGCMGGIGRTGLFMGGMVKVSLFMQQGAIQRALGHLPSAYQVIQHVRADYKPHAIETPEQEEFLIDYDPRRAAKLVKAALKIRKAAASA